MKKHLLLGTCLMALLAVAGCSDDDTPKNVVLTGGTQTSQTVYADETQGAEGGISFTAATDWTATVTEVSTTKAVGGSTVDWLTLSAYSGGPGEYTLTLTLKENNTGADRKAKIEIVCGGDVITITVEQKGTTESGETPEEPVTPVGKRLSRMEYTQVASEYPDSYNKHIMTFEYDAEGRLSVLHQISYTGDEQGYYADDVCTFTYTDGQMKMVYEEYGYSYDPNIYIAKLNEAGDVSLFYEEPDEYSTTTTAWMFKYDENGYLQQILEDYMYDAGEDDGEDDDDVVAPDPNPGWDSPTTRAFDHTMLKLTWQNGNLVSTIDDEPGTEENLMDWDYTSYTNDTPGIDFNVLSARVLFGNHVTTYSEWANMLFALRMLGQNSKNLIKIDLVDWAYEAGSAVEVGPDGEPVPVEPTTETTYHDEWAPYDYTFTTDNCLQRVTARCTLHSVTTEIATGEVIDEKVSYYDDEYVFTYE